MAIEYMVPCQTDPARISNASLELTSKVALAATIIPQVVPVLVGYKDSLSLSPTVGSK
jgi:hypothetical protein